MGMMKMRTLLVVDELPLHEGSEKDVAKNEDLKRVEEEEEDDQHSKVCARTEGHHKLDEHAKASCAGWCKFTQCTYHHNIAITLEKKVVDKERDLIKYNQLKSRKRG
jgi:hypothetical protein